MVVIPFQPRINFDSIFLRLIREWVVGLLDPEVKVDVQTASDDRQKDVKLTFSSALAEAEQESRNGLLTEFLSSAAYSGVQAPLKAVAQISDRTVGTRFEEATQFMEAPRHTEFLSSRWVAQQVGSVAGVLPWFIALHKGSSAVLRNTSLAPKALALAERGEAMNLSQTLSVNSFRALESGVAGFAFGSLLTPSRPDESLLGSRLRHGTSSALTFATLSFASSGLGLAGESLAARSPLASAVLKNEAAAGAISGIPAGLVAANSESLLAGKGFATFEDQVKQTLTFGLLGAGFGGLSMKLKDSPDLKIASPEAKPAVEVKAIVEPVTHKTAVQPMPETALKVADTGKLPAEPAVRTTIPEKSAGQAVTMEAPVAKPEAKSTNPVADKGEIKTTLADGTLVIEKPNGITITKKPNGDTMITNKDGTSVVNQADGYVVRLDAQGKEIDRHRPKGRIPKDEREFNVASMNVDPLAKAMSNLSQRPFVMDGIRFESVEGFYRYIQWSKDPAKQAQMPALFGPEARSAGRGCTFTEATFRGKTFELGSPEHHAVIKDAIRESLRQNPELAQQFAGTHPRPIIHNTGRPESKNTKFPGQVFSNILSELRQEIVDGKLVADNTLKPVEIPVPKTVSLSDALNALKDETSMQYHPVGLYAQAFRGVEMPVRSFLGGGKDSISFELGTGDVVKLTTNRVAPEIGQRPFDLPILNRGEVKLETGLSLNFLVQPKARTPVTEAELRTFRDALPKNYSFSDQSLTNIGVYNGQVKLIDYWAVRRVY